MSEELKLCPFCGSAAKLFGPGAHHPSAANCTVCDAYGPSVIGRTEAAAAWNRRATPPAMPNDDAFTANILADLARQGASPAGLSLAAQLFGVAPCEACGYRKLHCRCAPAMPSPPSGSAEHKELTFKLMMAQCASCSCQVKTPDITWHDAHCLYRVLGEAIAALESAAPVAPSGAQESTLDHVAPPFATPASQPDASERARFDDWWHEGAHPYRDLGGKKKPLLNEHSAWHVWLVATQRDMECGACGGTGSYGLDPDEGTCEECKGTGTIAFTSEEFQ